jgi:hypothetical protein
MLHTIYALVDPRTGAVRYVGVTKGRISKRLWEHQKCATSGSILPVHRWLRKLSSQGTAPQVIVIEQTEDRLRECYWISYYREQGIKLLNCTDGGDGLWNPSEETRRRLSESHKGQKPTEEHKAKLSAFFKGKPISEETKRKIGQSNKGKPRSAELRAVLSARNMGKKLSPESIAKAEATRRENIARGYVRKPVSAETRAKISATQVGRKLSEETKAKLSAIHKRRPGRPHSPETRGKLSAVQIGKVGKSPTPEVREKIRVSLTGRKRPPEVIAKMSAARKGKRPNRVYLPLSDEHRAKLLAGRLARPRVPMSEATKAKISAVKKQRFAERKAQTVATSK